MTDAEYAELWKHVRDTAGAMLDRPRDGAWENMLLWAVSHFWERIGKSAGSASFDYCPPAPTVLPITITLLLEYEEWDGEAWRPYEPLGLPGGVGTRRLTVYAHDIPYGTVERPPETLS